MRARKHNSVIQTMKDKAIYCFYCIRVLNDINGSFGKKSIDHFQPLSKGGSNKNYNKVVCCDTCNRMKGDFTPDEFVNKLKRLLEFKAFQTYTYAQIITIINQVKYIKKKQENINPKHAGFILRKII